MTSLILMWIGGFVLGICAEWKFKIIKNLSNWRN